MIFRLARAIGERLTSLSLRLHGPKATVRAGDSGIACRLCGGTFKNDDIRVLRGRRALLIYYHERCWQRIPAPVREEFIAVRGVMRNGRWAGKR